jgi:arginine repressor
MDKSKRKLLKELIEREKNKSKEEIKADLEKYEIEFIEEGGQND